MNFYSKYFPVAASAYSAAMLVYFTFISKENVSSFTAANIALMSFWSTYCWIVIYKQDNTIVQLTTAIESVLEKLRALIDEEENEEEEA